MIHMLNTTDISKLSEAVFETFNLLFVSAIISIPIGLVIGITLALYEKKIFTKNRYLIYILSSLVSIIRSIPFVLLMVIIIPFSFNIFGTSIGFIPSIIALSIIGIATVSRLVEQAVIDINPQIYDLTRSLAATKFQLFKDFIFVEARSSLILAFTSSLVSLLAYSSVVYIIGGGGLGYTAIQIGYYSPVGNSLMWASTIIMIFIVQVIQILGNIFSNYLNKKKRGH
ncbi:ABC transporter permease subunit [Acholeplasma granularum]|uniref:ABC transporter permease subunit n=1 Tax=Acholeplasma granularum TaxID=264635 RepID=UPI000472A0F5|nr:ABC transporter permease subunit [Acholeplasma granularum]